MSAPPAILKILSWNVKMYNPDTVSATVEQASPQAISLQECAGKEYLWPHKLKCGTQERHASVILCLSPELAPHNPRVVLPGHAVCADIAYPAPARVYAIYARNDSTSPQNEQLRARDDAIIYEDALRSPLPVFLAGDLNLVLNFGDHYTHDQKAYNPNRAPSEKVTRLKNFMHVRRLYDAKPEGLLARTYTSRQGNCSRIDYILGEQPAAGFEFLDLRLDHSPIVGTYAL